MIRINQIFSRRLERKLKNELDEKQAKLLYNSFILAQCNYCSMIWMFCSKTSNKKIKQIQKRGLQIVYNESHMSLVKPLIQDQGISVHRKHINIL